MLSVPVPSDMVISPLAIPWFINSSIMNDVSPFTFVFLPAASFFILLGDYIEPAFDIDRPVVFFEVLDGEPITPFLGPFSLL